MSIKDSSNLEFWWLSCSTYWNHLCNFGRGHYGEHSCVIDNYFKFGSVVQEMSLRKSLRTDNGRRPITIAHLEPVAPVSYNTNFEKSQQTTTHEKYGLDLDQDDVLLVLIWVETVCKSYQQMTKVATSKERVKHSRPRGYKTFFHAQLN